MVGQVEAWYDNHIHQPGIQPLAAGLGRRACRMETPSLRIELPGGEVVLLTWQDMMALPPSAQVEVGDFFPGRNGRGVRLHALLDPLNLPGEVRRVKASSVDGRFSNTLSFEDMSSRGILCYTEGVGPLAPTSGGPYRLWVVGSTDSCDHVKSVGSLTLLGDSPEPVGQWRKPRLAGLRRSGGSDWIEVCARTDIPHNGMLASRVGETELVLAHASGQILAFTAECPHLGARFPDEAVLEGGRLTCLRHTRRWDIFDGTCMEGGAQPLPRYGVKVEDGRVYVQLEPIS